MIELPKAGRELDALVAEKVMGDVPGQVWDREYSTDMAAAWAIVDELTPRRFNRVEVVFEIDGWTVMIGQWGSSTPGGEAVATFLPHAICLAALKAVGAEVSA